MKTHSAQFPALFICRSLRPFKTRSHSQISSGMSPVRAHFQGPSNSISSHTSIIPCFFRMHIVLQWNILLRF
jgi:hypothetical protein